MRNHIEREPGQPFLWGWDDESVFFAMDGKNLHEPGICIQDHPELHAAILRMCVEFVEKKEAADA